MQAGNALARRTNDGKDGGGYPSMGSVAAKFRGPNAPAMPAFVGLADSWKADVWGAGHMGPAFEPVKGNELPGRLALPAGVDAAQLQGADLAWANLQGARLEGANLESALLVFTNLRGADLRQAVLVRNAYKFFTLAPRLADLLPQIEARRIAVVTSPGNLAPATTVLREAGWSCRASAAPGKTAFLTCDAPAIAAPR